MPRPIRETRKAEEFLDDVAQNRADFRLAGVAAMARATGVSYTTMWKAVRRYRDMGRLPAVSRTSAGVPELPRTPVERLEERMTQDLLSGAIARGARILSVKELISRYGASARTVRLILDSLRQQGLLYAYGRHYESIPGTRAQGFKVVLIAFTGSRGMFTLPENETGFLRSCENACVNSGALLQVVILRRRHNGLALSDISGTQETALPKGEDVCGYIYMLDTTEAFDPAIMGSLLATRKPVAILDQAGVFPSGKKEYDLPRVRMFATSGHEQPGKDMARYLLAKGHRRMAFISPFHGDAWSQNRCAGVRRVIGLAGNGHSLTEFTSGKSAKTGEYHQEARLASRASRFEKQFLRWQQQAPPIYRQDLLALRETDIPLRYMSMGTRAAVYALLDKAVRDRTITAWIMASDHAALMAWDYCHEKKIDVPDTIAIVGFDDHIAASMRRITSYNYNFGAFASTAVHFLLRPNDGFWSRRRVVEIRGKIMVRETA